MLNLFAYYESQYKDGSIKDLSDINSNFIQEYHYNYIKKYPMWYYIDYSLSEYDPFNYKYNRAFYELAKFKRDYLSYKRVYRYNKKWSEVDEYKKYQCVLEMKWRWVYNCYESRYTEESYVLSKVAQFIFHEMLYGFYEPHQCITEYKDIFKEDYLTKTNIPLGITITKLIDHFRN